LKQLGSIGLWIKRSSSQIDSKMGFPEGAVQRVSYVWVLKPLQAFYAANRFRQINRLANAKSTCS
jgi:hypothetical protein